MFDTHIARQHLQHGYFIIAGSYPVAGASWCWSIAHSGADVAANDRGDRPQPSRVVRLNSGKWKSNALEELFELDVVEMARPKSKALP